jgi:hypothetical protein
MSFYVIVTRVFRYVLIQLHYFYFLVRNGFEHFVYSAQCSASYSEWLQHFKRG